MYSNNSDKTKQITLSNRRETKRIAYHAVEKREYIKQQSTII